MTGFNFKTFDTTASTSVLTILNSAIPMAHFLVAFARYKRGRFDEKRKAKICLAIQECIAPANVSSADIAWWITEGLPKSQQIYEPIEVLSQRLAPKDIRIARSAAFAITGAGRGEIQLLCLDLIEQLLPNNI